MEKIICVLSVWGFNVSSAGTAPEPVRIRMFCFIGDVCIIYFVF